MRRTSSTPAQVMSQLKMYIAALRIADDFGLDAVGIQYQQGLKDVVPASDLAEGLLNNVDRPPVYSRDGSRELYAGQPLPHFNEVDEGVAVDALVTNRIWTAMGFDPATTLHDVRWGEQLRGRVRVGDVDLRLGARVAQRRLRPLVQQAATEDVLPPRWRHPVGLLEARGDRVVPGVHRRRPPARRRRSRSRRRPPRRAKPSGGSTRRRRSGRSCTPSCTASTVIS